MTLVDKQKKILNLKNKLNAIILAHNYQLPEIQDIADFLGDSLELSRKVENLKSEHIFFCGVQFMAETAKILSPNKHIYLPNPRAGCEMANMVDIKSLKEFKQKHHGASVLCYVNTTAETKTECDFCCTSANAVSIANKIENSRIIFVPDKNLAAYVRTKTEKEIIPFPGFCYVHNFITKYDIKNARELYPDAAIIIHPESTLEASLAADHVLSTGGMVRFAKETDIKSIVIGTEEGIVYRLQKENPDKHIIPLKAGLICKGMKTITIDDLLKSMTHLQYEITLPDDIIHRAYNPIKRMLELS